MGVSHPHDAVLTAYAQSLIEFKSRELCRRPGFSRSDEEGVAQALITHLLSKAHLFDPNRASPNTFADRVIRSGIAMLLRDRRREKRAAGFTARSLDQPVALTDADPTTLRDLLTEADGRRRTGGTADEAGRAETAAAVIEAYNALPPDLQRVCRGLIDGTGASVARDLGLSRRQVRKAIARIYRRFEEAGLKDF